MCHFWNEPISFAHPTHFTVANRLRPFPLTHSRTILHRDKAKKIFERKNWKFETIQIIGSKKQSREVGVVVILLWLFQKTIDCVCCE